MGAEVMQAQGDFADVRDDGIAEGGYAYGADIADEQNGNEAGFFDVADVHGGGSYGTEQDMGGMEDVKKPITGRAA